MLAGLCLSTLGVNSLSSAQEAQPGVGNYYDLQDYSYFEPRLPDDDEPVPDPKPVPTPTPSPSPTPSAFSPVPSPSSAPGTVGGDRGDGNVTTAKYMAGGPMTFPQGDMAGARADANAFGKAKRSGSATLPTTTDLASTVPGYPNSSLPLETLVDDPDALTSQGASAAIANDPWRTVINPDRTVVTLAPGSLDRANAVAEDPEAYLDGEALGSSGGSCTPLPPSTTGTEFYEATCEEGEKPIDEARTCRAPLAVNVSSGGPPIWEYECDTSVIQTPSNAVYLCTAFQQADVARTCSFVTNSFGPRMGCLQYGTYGCVEPNPIESEIYHCPAPIAFPDGQQIGGVGTVTSENVDETQCQATTSGATCSPTGEFCTAGPETRVINGLSVTRPCWEWERTFQCSGTTQATDCGDIAGNPQCSFVRDECLDDPQVGACQVATKVYRCPLPGGTPDGTSQYICGDDVYCINDDCEPIEREASTEFKDALVGLHTLGQANSEFNEATMTLFSGTRETCQKKVFGLSNCCSGKGVPLLTPFLCNAAERELDKKDDKGLCHRVGSYCSDKVLGFCVTRKDAYCCFESKLSRILQEQGRTQINKPWGKPKDETCKGFALAEFQQLDLSVMDFSEVYAEFIDAAKLPDELEATEQIQQRIEDYLS